MAVISSIFWIIGLILSVTLAPQLRIWTWGPTMVCFACASIFALPPLWNEKKSGSALVIVITGSALVFWMAARQFFSAVPELASADFLLVSMAVATFVSFRAASHSTTALRIIVGGIALLTIASLIVIAKQVIDPNFTPIFHRPSSPYPAGFYGHYSYGGSFLIAVSLLLGGLAMHSKENRIVRLLLGIIAIVGFCAIYFTRSRGAIVGAAGGLGVLMLLTLMIGKRDGKKWFAPAVIAVPLVAGAIIFALFYVWSDALDARKETGGIVGMLDNAVRWHLIGIAISCIRLHPLLGGGARSFSWECFRFWDIPQMGIGSNKPEHVHNELLQTVAEYGIIGAGILIVFLCCVVIISVIRITIERRSHGTIYADGWRIGGLAGLAGLFIQSNFEGILRIAPGAILLALCISASCFRSEPKPTTPTNRPWFRLSLISLLGLAAAVPLAFAGVLGTRVSTILWPIYFGAAANVGNETSIDGLSTAIKIWPLQSLIEKRALTYQRAAAEEPPGETSQSFTRLALADYQASEKLHPFYPPPVIGTANLLSTLKQSSEAEAKYVEAIQLQGGMEAAFKAYFCAARHYHHKARSAYDPARPADSLTDFEIATRYMEKSFTDSWLHDTTDRNLRVLIHQNYGQTLAAVGENKAAMAEFDFATKLPFGTSSNYCAGLLLGRLAAAKWSDSQPEDALLLFTQASQRINSAANNLPEDVTPAAKVEYSAYLHKMIEYLKGAHYKPSQAVDLDFEK